jgi:adenylyltransferase/sulfurtransferase
VCGPRRDIHAPEDIGEVCAPVVPSDVALLPAALQDMLEGEHRIRSLMIIDVREPFEFSTAHFDGAINVPLAELPRRFGDLAGYEQVVFVCRVGERSARAALAARQAGHSTAIHLHGGMLAWIREIGTEQIIA